MLTSLSLVRLNKTAAAIRQADLAATGILEAQDKRIEVRGIELFLIQVVRDVITNIPSVLVSD